MKKYTGFSALTGKKVMLDVGAFFVNYDVTKDYAANVAAGKRTGATQGGGSFAAKPNYRTIKVDGVPENTKGMRDLLSWQVTMQQKMLEQDAQNTALALAAAKSEQTQIAGASYTKITGKDALDDSDYQNNVAYAGRIRGSSIPFIIVVKNAFNPDGLSWSFADQSETTTDCNFSGNYTAEDLENGTVPFDIYIPNDITGAQAAAALEGASV